MTAPKPTRRTPCTLDRVCESLEERLEMTNANRKGLSMFVVTNAETSKRTKIAVVYKMNAKDRGLCLNHCPFCGYDFNAWIDEAKRLGVIEPGPNAAESMNEEG